MKWACLHRRKTTTHTTQVNTKKRYHYTRKLCNMHKNNVQHIYNTETALILIAILHINCVVINTHKVPAVDWQSGHVGGIRMKRTTPKQSITIRLNQELMNYIRQEAERQGISVNAVISILLNESVHGRKEKA